MKAMSPGTLGNIECFILMAFSSTERIQVIKFKVESDRLKFSIIMAVRRKDIIYGFRKHKISVKVVS